MRKLLVSVALATATLAAVPAAAHPGPHAGWQHRSPSRHAVNDLLRELGRVEQRIDRSARRGLISPREAFGLRREARLVRNRLFRAGRNGFSGRELAQLRFRVDRLEQHVRIERRDRDGRRL